MRIALLDMDNTGFPNLALGKLATYFKGCDVALNPIDPTGYNEVFASRVFQWSPEVPNYAITGDLLPDDVEHLKPDFTMYGITDTAYGFTSRGCIRKCWFCSVWKKEGDIRAHAHPSEFIGKDDVKVILLDNNILAAPNCEETLLWLAERRIEVDFNQGLDIRLMTADIAKLLKGVKKKVLRFAFDDLKYTDDVMKGVSLLRKYKVTPSKYEAYVLHNGDEADTLKRIEILQMLYVDPFVMPFVDCNGKRKPCAIGRWCNKKQIFRKCTYEDYDPKLFR